MRNFRPLCLGDHPTETGDTAIAGGGLHSLALAAPEPLAVLIDIKPGHDLNPIAPTSRGLTPAAILSSDTFEVKDLDVTTLAFGPDGAVPVFDLSNRWGFFFSRRDVNHDGKRDLVAFYRTLETGIEFGDTEACVTGELLDGTPFEGCDDIVTVPGCGLGFELVFLRPPLMWAHGCRRRTTH